MKIEVKGLELSTTEALTDHAIHRLGISLAHQADAVSRVVVRLRDDNGPKGGVDKRCTMEATVLGHGTEVAEAQSADLYEAIDAAARRLGRSIERTLERHRS